MIVPQKRMPEKVESLAGQRACRSGRMKGKVRFRISDFDFRILQIRI
jgi:hypothetical protein